MQQLTGHIVAIMETWPLQLSLDTGSGQGLPVPLADDCVVLRQGQPIDPGSLRVGDRVTVSGMPAAAGGLRAVRVELAGAGR